jgi:hypothetical protein
MTKASAAQNVPFGRGHPAELPHPITAPNGGSRATAATSHCHAEQPMFQDTSNPNADYALYAG